MCSSVAVLGYPWPIVDQADLYRVVGGVDLCIAIVMVEKMG